MRNPRLLLCAALICSCIAPSAFGAEISREPAATPAPAALPAALPRLETSPIETAPGAPSAAQLPGAAEAAAEPAAAQPAASAAPAARAEQELSREKPAVARRFAELKQEFGAKDAPAVSAANGAPAPSLARAGADAPITTTDARGLTRQYSYDPSVPAEPLYKAAWRFVREFPERLRRIRAFRGRVKQLVGAITDENLWWSINRLKALELQEGILRSDNRALVNQWPGAGAAVKKSSHADFAGSSLEAVSIMKLFKSAMDLEEPTMQYQYAFAQNLHNRLHRMSHFLGTTLQEHILAVALKGKTNQWSIWATEEARHGPVLERVYNAARAPGAPMLTQQGETPRLPRNDAQYLVLSGMANRSLAELFAASAYLTIKANAKAGSPTDVALDGLYRDEVYHYIIMAAVNRYVFGQGRWERLYRLIRHDLDYNPGSHQDKVLHRRRFMSPLAYLETAYAILSVDKRIDDFIKKNLDEKKAADLIGPTYVTDAELEASIARGEQTRTKFFRMEQNPHLSQEDVELLEKRLPAGWIDASERKIKASDVREVIETYRKTLLRNPRYWAKKGFEVLPYESGTSDGRMILVRRFAGESGADAGALYLQFAGPSSSVRVSLLDAKGQSLLQARLDELSMRQIGALMDADGPGVAGQLEKLKDDLTPQEIMNLVGKTPGYMRKPIPVVEP